MAPTWRVVEGDCVTRLREMDAESVQCCVTSPPYFGLRDYGHTGQIGLEATPGEYVARLVEVFRGVRRALRDDGTLWLNIGDSYASNGGRDAPYEAKRETPALSSRNSGEKYPSVGRTRYRDSIVKGKDLLGIPWMLAFALRADGWYLRSDIIWAKPNPMPESVTDRPTSAHEHVFLLAKSARYFYDANAIREADSGQDHARTVLAGQPSLEPSNGLMAAHKGLRTVNGRDGLGRNKRNVWTVATRPYSGAHFATFPPKLVEPCVLAGCPETGNVLDPFCGSGTTGLVALRHGRSFVGVELHPAYATLARERIVADSPLLNAHAEVA